MTPLQKIRHLVLISAGEFADDDLAASRLPLSAERIEADYAALVGRDAHWDAINEVREGDAETGIPCERSRHYESKSVAAEYVDGSWVGWTYWYGGGKHGEPEAIGWMEDAYDLVVTEEEKVITVRTFAKAEAA